MQSSRAICHWTHKKASKLSCMHLDKCTSPINQSFNCFISSARESGQLRAMSLLTDVNRSHRKNFFSLEVIYVGRLMEKHYARHLRFRKGRVRWKRGSDEHDVAGHGELESVFILRQFINDDILDASLRRKFKLIYETDIRSKRLGSCIC